MLSTALCKTGKRCTLSRGAVLSAAARSPVTGPECTLPSPSPICRRHRQQQQSRKASNGTWRPVSVLDESKAHQPATAHGLWPLSDRVAPHQLSKLCPDRAPSQASCSRIPLPSKKIALDLLTASLACRIAHRLRDMQQLPYVVVTNPHISEVYDLYYNAFDQLRKLKEIKTLEDNDKLCDIIRHNLKSHLTVIPKLAMGILECGGLMDPQALDKFMNTILRSRISRRVIAEQHLSLTETFNSPYFSPGAKLSESDFIGEVFIKCSAKDVITRCAKAVTALARSTNGHDAPIPDVNVVGHLDASFPYILSHIEYIVGELLRNSVQAVIDRHQRQPDPSSPPPPVEVTVCEAQEHVIFRISDRGGGIPRAELPYLWSFSKGPQSAKRLENLGQVPRMAATMEELHVEDELGRADLKAPAAYQSSLSSLTSRPPNLRLGMGLPLSRVYAEYWAGSLNLHSLEGYGVDAFLQISRLGNKNEQLVTRASMDSV
ncbi:mitochondrial branched-chain alpha-ketoacid dehydrogenase kinase [Metarhizium robertsii]|uniref:Protein-serine/threonine kinase n=1 Tax=Metarhizium robertsii TaxID=568076 RepID=A0A0A1UU18_9HYPO|nr:mitochondrial branched-chain alpha-ketoacid dehydrogenase kinase [Metarhizium robertsii]